MQLIFSNPSHLRLTYRGSTQCADPQDDAFRGTKIFLMRQRNLEKSEILHLSLHSLLVQ